MNQPLTGGPQGWCDIWRIPEQFEDKLLISTTSQSAATNFSLTPSEKSFIPLKWKGQILNKMSSHLRIPSGWVSIQQADEQTEHFVRWTAMSKLSHEGWAWKLQMFTWVAVAANYHRHSSLFTTSWVFVAERYLLITALTQVCQHSRSNNKVIEPLLWVKAFLFLDTEAGRLEHTDKGACIRLHVYACVFRIGPFSLCGICANAWAWVIPSAPT